MFALRLIFLTVAWRSHAFRIASTTCEFFLYDFAKITQGDTHDPDEIIFNH